MGAWGLDTFENDQACDWLYTLEKTSSIDFALSALLKIASNEGYIEAPECCEALAAAEVVAASRSGDFSRIPDEAAAWLRQKRGIFRKSIAFEREHAEIAAAAVEKIAASSELRELWEETNDFAAWVSLLNGLARGLRQPKS